MARERFLAGDEVGGSVRDTILRSWQRCAAAGVAPSGPHQLPSYGELDSESAFLRAVRAVITPIFAEMQTEGVAVLVSDAEGRLLHRWAEDRSILEALDEVAAAPGYDCGEQYAGTTALGTVLEERHPVAVRGAEHYSDVYREISAFGAPVIHPVSGTLEGAIDFVSSTDRASELVIPLVIRLASEIGERLLSGYAAADRALLDGYLRADRRGYRRAIVAMNDRMMIANPLADDMLKGVDRQALQEKVRRAIVDGRRKLILHAGEPAMYATIDRVDTPDALAGAVVQLRMGGFDSSRRGRVAPAAPPQLTAVLPGRSPAWTRFLEDASAAVASGQHILLVGEPGAGKRTSARRLALAIAKRAGHSTLDVGSASRRAPRSWLNELNLLAAGHSTPIVMTGLEKADDGALTALCAHLDEMTGPSRIFATFQTGSRHTAPPDALVARFTHVLTVPPLRQRADDIPELIDAIAANGQAIPPRIDDAVKRTLSTFDWPGNVRQLADVVEAALRAAGGTWVRLPDLPPSYRAAKSGRRLSKLEQVERAAIIAALQTANGNKKAAAEDLGISRATLYRRLVVLDIT
ncbi:sigma-54-dependent Fis family transcriptional regulator [Pseudonocardia lutea]|uniref:Sigma-54-dependent Fis family transcriptional regulator n=1 Tax=Pseudonocardia lutea TaxID=2172015 RepID=A0ABW1I589_9PSEU